MFDFGLKSKLMAGFLPIGLLPVSITAYVILNRSNDAFKKQEMEKLISVRNNKKLAIQNYFSSVRDDIVTLAQNKMIADAVREFSAGYNIVKQDDVDQARQAVSSFYVETYIPEYKTENDGADFDVTELVESLDDAAIDLQYQYIVENGHRTYEMDKLESARVSSYYNTSHKKYHASMKSMQRNFGLEDIFLIEPTGGAIVYSVFKNMDFATSLIDGPYADSGLAEAFRTAVALDGEDAHVFTDFRRYRPAYDAPASFIAAPIVDGGALMGVLAFRIPLERISQIMGERAGLGATGSTYLVGSDHLMRSNMHRDSDHRSVIASFRNPELGRVGTAGVVAALAGHSDATVGVDVRGRSVLSAYAPLEVLGQTWAIVAEVDEAEAMATVDDMRFLIMSIGLGGAVMVLVLGFVIARSLARPISAMTDAMARIAAGDFEVAIPAIGRRDEVGQMAAAVEVFKTNSFEVAQFAERKKEAAEKSEADRRRMMQAIAGEFERTVGRIVGAVVDASSQLESTSSAVAATANAAREASANVSSASEEAWENVQSVSVAAEQLTSSIAEIGRQVAESSKMASRAVTDTRRTDEQIRELAAAASKIGNVVGLISEIADQTNLLALNATIESARAGDTGKGFGVVAAEVKQLAAQTTNATRQIGGHVSEIQTLTEEAVAAIGQISATIETTNAVAASIASSVEEQGAATDEIARNVEQAAGRTRAVSDSIRRVSQGAADTGTAVGEIGGAVRDLNRQSELLQAEVVRFLGQVRADHGEAGVDGLEIDDRASAA